MWEVMKISGARAMPGSVFKTELIQGPYLCDMCGRTRDLPGPIWRLRRQNGSPVQKRLVGIGIAEISEEVTMLFFFPGVTTLNPKP